MSIYATSGLVQTGHRGGKGAGVAERSKRGNVPLFSSGHVFVGESGQSLHRVTHPPVTELCSNTNILSAAGAAQEGELEWQLPLSKNILQPLLYAMFV